MAAVHRLAQRFSLVRTIFLSFCIFAREAHAKLTHTYAATRRLSGMPVGRATVMLSVFQICWSLLKKGGLLDSP